MAEGYDRYENEDRGGSFVMGLLTGTVLGAGLGMLFAPKAGAELRSQLGERAGNLAGSASEGYRKASEAAGAGYRKASDAASEGYRKASDAAGEWAERGREVYGKAREAVARGADEAAKYVRDASTGARGAQPSTAGAGSNGTSTSGLGPDDGNGSQGPGAFLRGSVDRLDPVDRGGAGTR